jgi:hypothetical protein
MDWINDHFFLFFFFVDFFFVNGFPYNPTISPTIFNAVPGIASSFFAKPTNYKI